MLVTCLAGEAAVAFLHLFTGWPSGGVYHILVVAGGSAVLAVLYALAALFVTYGSLRDSEDAEERPQPEDSSSA